jgi:hypothetical protein
VMPWPKPMALVEVTWVDSHASGGWRSDAEWTKHLDPDESPLTCRSAGYLYRRDRRVVVLMQSQSASGQLSDAMQIPTPAVLSVRVVERARKP